MFWHDENQQERWQAPNYSTDIAAAWLVVEKLRGAWDISSGATSWVAHLSVSEGPWSDRHAAAEAEAAPHAICLAALKAIGYKQKII
jgi:hypothetical protein